MNIQFDSSITRSEAAGLVLLLTSLFPELSSAPVNNLTPTAPAPRASDTDAQPSHMAIIGAGMARAEVEAVGTAQMMARQLIGKLADGPTLVPPSTEPAPGDAPRRTRRTKAQIEADEAAAKAAATPAEPVQAEPKSQVTTDRDAPSEPASTPATKPPTAEDLRTLLNGYIQRHTMEEAIAKLNSYGFNRLSEVLAAPVEKLIEVAEALRG